MATCNTLKIYLNYCNQDLYGGDAEEAGWTIVNTGTEVIAASVAGDVVSAGSGVLMQLIGDITSDCIVDIIISDSNGIDLMYDIEILASTSFFTTSLSSSTSFSCNADVCLWLNGSSLNYASSLNIGGFQFDHDGCIEGVSLGGETQTSDFTISMSPTTVIGFSFSGSFIGAGNGVLLELTGDIDMECLSDIVLSTSEGVRIDDVVLLMGTAIQTEALQLSVSSSDNNRVSNVVKSSATLVSTTTVIIYDTLEQCEALSSCNINSNTSCLPSLNMQYKCPLDSTADGLCNK